MGRVLTLLSHYWRDDDPSELTEAIARDWADILDGLPQDAIAKACLKYLRTEPGRKPTPGAIYQMALEQMPRPKTTGAAFVPDPPRPPRVTAEQAKQILKAAGFSVNKFGGLKDDE